ncbi:hypothetical protein BCB4_0051 [Bacillus phage B4]|uniref:Uncharacterized protein n=2 Tax=Bequatrovirus B4 TaxID=1918005 RepID=J9PQG5_9CAUD|nr:hypothetical protein BCB4_0051 [Bacillus phage B4]YP_009783645.1 hypothetical protein QLX26_gp049 [Bacillus phage B5S]AEW47283.1 hypothetical protein B5S_0049 [Bacillus phage B5S]AEZ65844.1 hypothetical protein BCB4_0051 [Bacillus phage B4]
MKKVVRTSPVEVGDILYNCDLNSKGELRVGAFHEKVEVTVVDIDGGIFIAESVTRREFGSYLNDRYIYSMDDMMRQKSGYYSGSTPEKAFTYREKLTIENDFWRGKPKAGDIYYGKRFIESDNTYSSITGKFKVLGVTTEAFSAAPIDKDNNLDENETLIFDIDNLLEISLHGTHPVQLFTTQDNAHTAYLHKQIEKKNREAAQ